LTFNINPSNLGLIECNRERILSNYTIYDSDTRLECESKSNAGFQFSSWSGDQISPPLYNNQETSSTLSDYLFGSWFNSENNNNTTKTTFTVSKYGTLTANFINSTPVLIDPNFWTPFYGLIPGLFIPSIISWLNGKRQRRHLSMYRKEIDSIYTRLDEKRITREQCLETLDNIKKRLTQDFEKGRISESHYDKLNDRISEYKDKFNANE
jgi:hypothetical protein